MWRLRGIARISRVRRRPGGFACGRQWALTSRNRSPLSLTGRFSALPKLRTRVRFPSLALEDSAGQGLFPVASKPSSRGVLRAISRGWLVRGSGNGLREARGAGASYPRGPG